MRSRPWLVAQALVVLSSSAVVWGIRAVDPYFFALTDGWEGTYDPFTLFGMLLVNLIFTGAGLLLLALVRAVHGLFTRSRPRPDDPKGA